jgi:hypothetical protein
LGPRPAQLLDFELQVLQGAIAVLPPATHEALQVRQLGLPPLGGRLRGVQGLHRELQLVRQQHALAPERLLFRDCGSIRIAAGSIRGLARPADLPGAVPQERV